MIDSLNITSTADTSTNTTSTSSGATPLLEIVLSDAPFLALGFLSLALVTFYGVMSKSHRAAIYLQTAASTAALATLIDFVAMFYSSDYIAVNSFNAITSPTLRTFIIALLALKQILLAISLPFHLLYFDIALRKHVTAPMDVPPDANPGEKRRTTAFSDSIMVTNREGQNALWSYSALARAYNDDSLALLAKMMLYAVILVIFGLEVGWRLGFLLNKGHSAPFNPVNKASFALQLILLVIFASCPFRFIFQTSPSGRRYVFKLYGGLLGGITLALVVVIGSLASTGFSEQIPGRLFQGVQMYVLIVWQLILDFASLSRHKGSRYSTRFTIVNQAAPRHSSFEGLGTPTVSTFRVSPPSVSTPSPPNIPSGKVSLQPVARPWSTGTMLDPAARRPQLDRRGSSMSARLRSWVHISKAGMGRSVLDEEEGRKLRSPTAESFGDSRIKSSFSVSTALTYDPQTERQTRYTNESARVSGGLPASPQRARRSDHSVVRQTSRRMSSVVGIKRTVSSPGARLLVLGMDYEPRHRSSRTDSAPTDVTTGSMRYSGLSLSSIQQLGFPRPPSRETERAFFSEIDADSNALDEMDDLDDLPLPRMPAVREKMRGRNMRFGSDATHVDVTSFIEGRDRSDSHQSRPHGQFFRSSPQLGHASLRRDVTSFIEGGGRLSRVSEYSQSTPRPQTWALHSPSFQAPTSLAQIQEGVRPRAMRAFSTSTVSSEAPTEMYLPGPGAPDGTATNDEEWDSDHTPTQSIIDMRDVHEVRVRRAFVQRQRQDAGVPSLLQIQAMSRPGDFDPKPLPMPLADDRKPREGHGSFTLTVGAVQSGDGDGNGGSALSNTLSPDRQSIRSTSTSTATSRSSRMSNPIRRSGGLPSSPNPSAVLSTAPSTDALTIAGAGARMVNSSSSSLTRPKTMISEYTGTMPESPTLPPSAGATPIADVVTERRGGGDGTSGAGGSGRKPLVQRAKTTGREWYAAKYGKENMI